MLFVFFLERFHSGKRDNNANDALLSLRGHKIEASAGFMGEETTSVAPGFHVCGLGCSADIIGWICADLITLDPVGYVPFTNVH
jgi:hypothetical protein